jgi:hypothetical protein
MQKRVIFAPEKKELRVESYTRRSTETNWAASPYFVVLRIAAAVFHTNPGARCTRALAGIALHFGDATEKARFA